MKQSLQFKIELFGAKKSIWRCFVVPETISLKKFHEVIQVVMGWENYHLYSFTFGREIFSAWTEEEEENAEKKLTKEIIARFFAKRGACGQYEYDPGDGWSHIIVLEDFCQAGEQKYLCLDGAMACPPEDVGGLHGYADFCKEVKARKAGKGGPSIAGWHPAYDPMAFDLEEINSRLKMIR